MAMTVCSGVCALPMVLSVSSFMVCGFMLIRVTPWRFMTSSLSNVVLSGLPASMANSLTCDRSNDFSIMLQSLSICSADMDDGVPPPTYIDMSRFPEYASATYAISFSTASRYASTLFLYTAIGYEVNEQYKHLVGQNGMPIYRQYSSSSATESMIFFSLSATATASSAFSREVPYISW